MKIKLLIIFFLFYHFLLAQNVLIVVIDGGRYSETFGAGDKYIPHLYNDLKPLGEVFTNFRIADEGKTETNPGQSSILTGTWQQIANDGTERPTKPTLFEYFRKEKGCTITENFVIGGKKKINALSCSTDSDYGMNYRATEDCKDTTDVAVYNELVMVMNKYHPRLMLINFPDVDHRGHDNNWNGYLKALTTADSLVYLLWQKIQNDPYYKDKTTLFVTNDHGRHDKKHGGFKDHGDDCDGCEHIMLLAIGKGFPQNKINPDLHYQIGLCATTGDLLGFETPNAVGKSLLIK